ncbi:MAG TPA: phytanoyl-CoA dioxygenase family protein [Nevskia sp.]|nr:phytanoyl-CoA dioxygenase family protein [Nevskia sp.]
MAAGLEENGYAVVEGALDAGERAALCKALADLSANPRSGGQRNLLVRPEVAALCRHPGVAPLVRALLGPSAFACKATLFDKTPAANWKVAWHQDLSIPVRGECRPPGWKGWSVKAGVLHAQPPAEVLERMLAVRVHLDDSNAANGALRLIPRSHRNGRLDDAGIEHWKAGPVLRCDVKAGGLLLMRPLTLHASSAGAAPLHRRVVHLEFAAGNLPEGLDWAARVAL